MDNLMRENSIKSLSLSEVCLKNFHPVYKYQGSPDVIRSRSAINTPDILQTPPKERYRKSLSPLLTDPAFVASLELRDNIKLNRSQVIVNETESRTTQTVHFDQSVAIQTESPPFIETEDADTQTDKKKKCWNCCQIM